MSSSESDSSHESDFHILHTRSTSYRTTQQNSQSPSSTASSSSNNQKKTNRLTFLKCTEHDDDNKNTWTSMHSNCRDCTRFTNLLDGLKVNVLPTEWMFWICSWPQRTVYGMIQNGMVVMFTLNVLSWSHWHGSTVMCIHHHWRRWRKDYTICLRNIVQ